MTDMSVEAKERAFKKPRAFTPEQTEWIESCIQLSLGVGGERLVMQSFRWIFLHLGVPRDRLVQWASERDKALSPLPHEQVVQGFQALIQSVSVFRGDLDLRAALRDLARMCALTPHEMRSPPHGLKRDK